LIFKVFWLFHWGFKSPLAHHKKRNPVVIETTGFSLFFNALRHFWLFKILVFATIILKDF